MKYFDLDLNLLKKKKKNLRLHPSQGLCWEHHRGGCSARFLFPSGDHLFETSRVFWDFEGISFRPVSGMLESILVQKEGDNLPESIVCSAEPPGDCWQRTGAEATTLQHRQKSGGVVQRGWRRFIEVEECTFGCVIGTD